MGSLARTTQSENPMSGLHFGPGSGLIFEPECRAGLGLGLHFRDLGKVQAGLLPVWAGFRLDILASGFCGLDIK
jgi:hypothetical protein